MIEIKDYLIRNYYSRVTKQKVDGEALLNMLNTYKDNVFIAREDKELSCVAFFFTLCDDTYGALGLLDISNARAVSELLQESGDNIHFIMIATNGVQRMLRYMKEFKQLHKPKSVSWWNPDMTYLHKYNFN